MKKVSLSGRPKANINRLRHPGTFRVLRPVNTDDDGGGGGGSSGGSGGSGSSGCEVGGDGGDDNDVSVVPTIHIENSFFN